MQEEEKTLDEQSVRALMREFYEWREKASGITQQRARERMLFVALLLRYCGMRLGEALAFNDAADIEENAGFIVIRGKWKRRIPVPGLFLKRLLELRGSSALIYQKGEICSLDQGYVRRIFMQRAEAAGLKSASPSALRSSREAELLRFGADLPSVRRYLGKNGSNNELSARDSARLAEIFIKMDQTLKAGMHNSFSGRISDIRFGGFSCMGTVLCDGGAEAVFRCTNRTASRMGLAPGGLCRLSCHALKVRPAGKASGKENVYEGRIMELVRGAGESKILIALTTGELVTAIWRQEEMHSLMENSAYEKIPIRISIAPEDFEIMRSEVPAQD